MGLVSIFVDTKDTVLGSPGDRWDTVEHGGRPGELDEQLP